MVLELPDLLKTKEIWSSNFEMRDYVEEEGGSQHANEVWFGC